MNRLSPTTMRRFRATVRRHYRRLGRRLPWRETVDPYAIMISEVMLQQTQVDRVIPKYLAFLQHFTNFSSLAQAPLKDVLIVWQGLGYNRRALMLKKAATAVCSNHSGELPQTIAELEALPGIGPYTARAIATFAFNQPHVLIETNIRTVFIHSFFANRQRVHDQQLLPLIAQTLDNKNPRVWYWALMDYGSYLKVHLPNPSRLSAHYAKQASFKNSTRQLRGHIVRILTQTSPLTKAAIIKSSTFSPEQVDRALKQLVKEGLLRRDKRNFLLG